MEVDYVGKIDEARIKAKSFFQTTKDIDELKAASCRELSFYESLIPEFFSYHGEAQKIKDMYSRLKSIDYTRNRVIPFIDMNIAFDIYKDYNDGMLNFVMDSGRDGITTEELEKMKEMLKVACDGDNLFIDSIFGGKNNKLTEEELTTAVTNIEFLIDFIPALVMFKEKIESITGKTDESDLFKNSMVLLVNSVGDYCSKTMKVVFTTYEDIINSLNGVTTESVKQEETFKLF